MAPRLYRITRPLYHHVERALRTLGLADFGSPTTAALVALYVTGLILLDERQTQTRVARFLPARCHDALNRLVRLGSWSTRTIFRRVIAWVKRLDLPGSLVLDDVIIEKAFAKRLPWAGWTYAWSKKRQVYGLHVVVWLWCSDDGQWRIPVAFRIWRPKRSCAPHAYRTKLQLADAMLTELRTDHLPFAYVVFDAHYTAGWFTKRLHRLGIVWQGELQAATIVHYRGRRQSVAALAQTLRLKWRAHLGLRAVALRVYAPKYGSLRLVVTKNRHGNFEYRGTNDLGADLTTVAQRKRARWSIETIFRDSKQFAGLEACQGWTNAPMVRHVALVFLTFIVLQLLRTQPKETVGGVKDRWQLAVTRSGEQPPPPLTACPAQLRPTA